MGLIDKVHSGARDIVVAGAIGLTTLTSGCYTSMIDRDDTQASVLIYTGPIYPHRHYYNPYLFWDEPIYNPYFFWGAPVPIYPYNYYQLHNHHNKGGNQPQHPGYGNRGSGGNDTRRPGIQRPNPPPQQAPRERHR